MIPVGAQQRGVGLVETGDRARRAADLTGDLMYLQLVQLPVGGGGHPRQQLPFGGTGCRLGVVLVRAEQEVDLADEGMHEVSDPRGLRCCSDCVRGQFGNRVRWRCTLGPAALPGPLRMTAQVLLLEFEHPVRMGPELLGGPVQEHPVPGRVGVHPLPFQFLVGQLMRRDAVFHQAASSSR